MRFSFPPGAALAAAYSVVQRALLPLIMFGVTQLYAQSSEIGQGSINAVIGSDSGKERRLEGHPGYIGRAGLRPGQTVKITLHCPAAQKGDAVIFMALDGGRVLQAEQALRVGQDGTATCKYEGGSSPGLYRILVRAGSQEQLLEFYVLDLARPNNPPRVRIVD
jgi:hypothetical protein